MRKRKKRRDRARKNPVNIHQPAVSRPQVFADEHSSRTPVLMIYAIRALPILVALALFVLFLVVQQGRATGP